MESCSGAFLWNKNTQKSYVFHTHVGTNWPETKKLFQKLCAQGNWEITPASGKGSGAWETLEEIATEMEQETGGRVKRKPTAHVDPDKEAYQRLSFSEQREVPHCSYMQNSQTGEVVAFHEETLMHYWENEKFAAIFGDNLSSAFANAYQYITRKGTVLVCCFDGKDFTHTPPQPDGTPEMTLALQKLQDVFVSALIAQAGDTLNTIREIDSPELRKEAIKHQLYRNNPMMDATQKAVVDLVLNPQSDILNPERARQADDSGRAIYAKSIWHGMYFGDFEGYVDKALERTQSQTVEARPEITAALEKFHNGAPSTTIYAGLPSTPTVPGITISQKGKAP